MATETTTLKSVAITAKAYEIAAAESKRRKDIGIPASLTNVISEAIVIKYSTVNADEERSFAKKSILDSLSEMVKSGEITEQRYNELVMNI